MANPFPNSPLEMESPTGNFPESNISATKPAAQSQLKFPRITIFNNPILFYEFIARLRKKTSFLFLFFLLVPVTLVFLFFWDGFIKDTQPGEMKTRIFFLYFNYAEGALLFILIPLLCATSVNTEYEKDTWDLLFTTPLSPPSILIGKFLAAILFIVLLILSLVPINGLSMIIGGISPTEILVAFLLLMEVIFIVGLIGLFFSGLCKRTWIAVCLSYIAIGFYGILFIFPSLIFNISSIFSPLETAWFYFVGGSLTGGISSPIHTSFYWFHIGGIAAVLSALILFCYLGLIRALQKKDQPTFWSEMGKAFHTELKKIRPYLSFKFSRTDYLPDGKNPVRIKETWDFFGRHTSFLLIWLILLLFTGGYILTRHTYFVVESRNIARFFRWKELLGHWPILLLPFFVLPFAANCIRQEFIRDTWELLSATLLTSRKIVCGKFWAGWYIFQLQFWAFFVCFLAAGLYAYAQVRPGNPFSLELLVGTVWISYVSSLLFLCTGMVGSAYLRTFFSSNAFSFSLVLLVLIGGNTSWLSGNDPWLGSLLSPYTLIQHYGDRVNHYHGWAWWTILLEQTLWMSALSGIFLILAAGKCRKIDSRGM